MRLLTLNCHAWQEENQIEKIQHLAAVIKEKQYDVIALQEVMQLIDPETDEKIKADNYAVVLLNELLKLGVSDYRFVWDMAHIGFDVYEEGLAILTKCEIKNAQSFLVTQSQEIGNFRTRRIVGLEMVYNQKPVAVYSCHLGWWHDEIEPFKYQWERLHEEMREDRLSLLLGDFNNNANIRGEGYDYLMRYGLWDTYILAKEKDMGATVQGEIAGWQGNQLDLRIDLILASEKLEVQSSKVIFNGVYKEVVSDHYGVEVEMNYL